MLKQHHATSTFASDRGHFGLVRPQGGACFDQMANFVVLLVRKVSGKPFICAMNAILKIRLHLFQWTWSQRGPTLSDKI